MTHISIIIKEIEDKTPALPHSNEKNTKVGELSNFVILEKGMASGKTSVAIFIKLPDGKYVMAETSAEIFNGMASALKGADIRFEEKRIKKN